MSFIYLTGPSGVGKSTVRNELVSRGYEAHDTDEDGMSAWYNNQTNELEDRPEEVDRAPDWYDAHDFRMLPDRVEELSNRAKSKLIFLCGSPANDKDFMEYYDKIIYLVVNEETLKHRVATRDTNDFGKSKDELDLILYWHGRTLERFRKLGATMIDATRPLDVVVDDVLAASH